MTVAQRVLDSESGPDLVLEGLVRPPKTEQRLVSRARIVLLAADGKPRPAIATELGTWPERVSRWRIRYAGQRIEGLWQAPRPGPKRR